MNNENHTGENQLISVIMPVYNAEKTVLKSIESIITQNYQEWELIVVDDGSSDASGRLCDQEASLDARIRVHHLQNSGVSAARNYGLHFARGELICFIDSDDEMRPNALRTIAESATDNDLLIFGYNICPSNFRQGFEKTVFYSSIAEFTADFPAIHRYHLLNCVWNKCFKRSIIAENVCTFPLNLSMGEDLLFVLSYIRTCKTIKVSDQVLYDYNTGSTGSLSQVYRLDAFETQKYLKEETDATFHSNKNVVGITSYIFTNHIIEELKKVVYSEGMSRAQKLALIKSWMGDPYFREQFAFIGSELPQSLWIKRIVQRNDVWGFYAYTNFIKTGSAIKQSLIKRWNSMR